MLTIEVFIGTMSTLAAVNIVVFLWILSEFRSLRKEIRDGFQKVSDQRESDRKERQAERETDRQQSQAALDAEKRQRDADREAERRQREADREADKQQWQTALDAEMRQRDAEREADKQQWQAALNAEIRQRDADKQQWQAALNTEIRQREADREADKQQWQAALAADKQQWQAALDCRKAATGGGQRSRPAAAASRPTFLAIRNGSGPARAPCRHPADPGRLVFPPPPHGWRRSGFLSANARHLSRRLTSKFHRAEKGRIKVYCEIEKTNKELQSRV